MSSQVRLRVLARDVSIAVENPTAFQFAIAFRLK